jgi:hypothetical protein
MRLETSRRERLTPINRSNVHRPWRTSVAQIKTHRHITNGAKFFIFAAEDLCEERPVAFRSLGDQITRPVSHRLDFSTLLQQGDRLYITKLPRPGFSSTDFKRRP